jgi:transcriptional regulator GlxA family with amidase domain
MQRLVVLALDGVMPFELGIASRIFSTANVVAGKPLYEITTCTVDGTPVATDADFELAVAHDASALRRADVVVIPPQAALGPTYETGELAADVGEALQRVSPRARTITICTASFVLAAAGLLEGRPATTHWSHVDAFRRIFPDVRLRPDVLFVDDGDILTSAGAASGLDLCLHVLRGDHGADLANKVARRCIVSPWRDGGQSQYIEQPVVEPEESSTAAARRWALSSLDRPIGLRELAKEADMSVRTFTRRFRAELGVSPGQWLATQRVETARRLLETTDLPVEAVARRSGFGSSTSLRQHLHAATGIAPLAYRRSFRGPAAVD